MKFVSFAIVAAAAQQPNDAKTVVEVTTGFMEGALDAEGLYDLEKCVKQSEMDLQIADKLYKDCTTHTLSGKADCIHDIGDLIGQVKASIADCKQVKADW